MFSTEFLSPTHMVSPSETMHTGRILDYVLVNQRFRSSVLDTRVFQKTYLQSNHSLVVTRVRLKPKAIRRRVQREPRHQVDMRKLGEQNVEEFRRVLAEELDANPTGDVD